MIRWELTLPELIKARGQLERGVYAASTSILKNVPGFYAEFTVPATLMRAEARAPVNRNCIAP
jgi:hypothetical protein